MKKHLAVAILIVSAFFARTANARYIGPDAPKGCSSCGCKCTGAPSRSLASNTSSGLSASEGNLAERVPVSRVGQTLALDFVYNSYNADGSRATVDTVMGYGWTHSYNIFLFSQAGVMFRWDGDGRVIRYGLGAGGTFIAAPGYFETLTQSGGVFMITQKDQTKYTFQQIAGSFLVSGPVYRLTKIVDRNGNTTTLTYSGGNLIKITDTYARSLTFGYNAQGKLVSVTDELNRVTTLQYDSTGHLLTKITDPNGKSVLYTYNTYFQLANKTDKAGRTFSYVYSSGSPGLPTAIRDASGAARATLSNPSNWSTDATQLAVYLQRVYTPSTTTNTDGRGNQWKYSYDANGYLTQTVAPDGATVKYRYDANTLQLAKATDANNNTTSYSYDSNGNLLSMTDALGNTTNYSYDPTFNQMTKIIDARGRVTSYTIDPANGNRLKETDPLSQTRTWTYDANGNVLTHTDKNGNTTQYVYDAFGNVIKVIDPLGNITTMTYDAVGDMGTRTDANAHTTSYQYDGLNRLTQTTDPTGRTDKTQYDGEGNRIQTTDRLGRVTQYLYDIRQRLIKITDALLQNETYSYDGSDNRISFTDRNGHLTRYAYDVQNRQISITDALGNVSKTAYDPVGNATSSIDANGHASTYTYDADNRRISMTDTLNEVMTFGYDTGTFTGCGPGTCGAAPGSSLITTQIDANGKVTYFKYDALGRQIRSVRKVGSTVDNIMMGDAVTVYVYDAVGNRTSMTEPDGNTTMYQYDADNRRIKEINAAGDLTTLTYDGVSNTITITAPNGNVTTNTYDSLDRLAQVSDSVGPVASYGYDAVGNRTSVTDGNGNVTQYSYDGLNRMTTMTDPLGKITTKVYDAIGNLTKTTDRNSNSATYIYDNINRRISTTDALTHTTQMKYDGVGNLTRLTDANSNATQYVYDAVNRPTGETYADGLSRTFAYDAVGNLLSRTDQKGQTTLYTYNDLYFLLGRSYPGAINDTFTYDLSGRMLTAQRGSWPVTFTYDGANRVTQTAQNGRTILYLYDIPGRKRQIAYPGGRVVTEYTDARTRLDHVNDASMIVQYAYDFGNRVTNRAYRNGASSVYSYDADDRSLTLTYNPGGFAGFNYAYDNEGNKNYENKSHDPAHSDCYAYDAAYRLMNFKVGTIPTCVVPSTQIAYNLDSVGNLCKTTDTCQFNSTNEEIKLDACTIPYDNNGNLTNDCAYAYAYDEENRLTSATGLPGLGVVGQYQYDALGRRVQKIAGSITQYFYDGARIIEEQDGAGATQATYVYGNYIDEVLTMDRAAQAYYYHQNTLWSVEAVTDSTGAVAERYSYDAYGLPSTGSTTAWGTPHSVIGNPWMFTGRQWDEETGLYFYRARYFDPVKDRFLQRDPLEYPDGPNLYAYVRDRPTYFVDPDGLRACCVQDADLVTTGAFRGQKSLTDYYPSERNPYWGNSPGTAGAFVNPPRAGEVGSSFGDKVQFVCKISGNGDLCGLRQSIRVVESTISARDRRAQDDARAHGIDLSRAPARQEFTENGDSFISFGDPPGVTNAPPNFRHVREFVSCCDSACDRSEMNGLSNCRFTRCCITWRQTITVRGGRRVDNDGVEIISKTCTTPIRFPIQEPQVPSFARPLPLGPLGEFQLPFPER